LVCVKRQEKPIENLTDCRRLKKREERDEMEEM
jgi:hypothetical protein